MVIKRDFMMDQISELSEGLKEARELVQKGQLVKADGLLAEILGACTRLRDDCEGAALDRFEAEVHTEVALLASTRGDGTLAGTHLEKAMGFVEPLAHESPDDPALFGLFATLQLNLGAMYAAAKRYDDAVPLLNDVVERLMPRLDKTGEGSPIVQMVIAALQNRATVRAQQNDLPSAIADIGLARETASRLGQMLGPSARVDLSLRLAGLERQSGNSPGAMKHCGEALEVSTEAVHKDPAKFHAIFLRSKIAMADACFENGHYSDGEDHLFEAVDRMPDLIDTVLVGMDLYAALLSKSDGELEDGGLPRDEVEDSFAELLAKLDTRCQDPELCSLAHARFRALTDSGDKLAMELAAKEYGDEPVDRWRKAVQVKLRAALSQHAH